jgi:hypothetical protein
MSVKGKGAYKGKHWMQLPENREKVIAMAKHRAKLRNVAKQVVKTAKRGTYKPRATKAEKPFIIRTHGYRIILDKNEIRIENE